MLAGRTSGQHRQALGHHDHPSSAQHGAHLLRAHHGVGLRRRPGSLVHLHERLPGPRRAAAEVLGRPDGSQVHGRPGTGPQPAPSSHGRAVGPHRDARRRALRTRRRRHDPQGQRPSSSHPHRQAAQRPLRAAAPDAGRSHRRVQGRARTLRSGHLLERDDGRPFDRRTIHRYVATWPSGPVSATSIRTSSATRSPPSRSTGA